MRLLRIEAERYGALTEKKLGDLGPGLTVVHGPNEAGKSTFTALVRHVLYGFPTPAAKQDRPYLSEAGKRVGRLVFEDEAGTWVVERSEGPHGGDVAVRAIGCDERPSLVSDLTRGVSELAYRVVFGFGLEEMARIEELRGQQDDVIGRLYAASAGLAVSPMDVIQEVETAAKELFAPRASKPRINRLAKELRDLRSRVRDSELAADTYRADHERLDEVDGLVDDARGEQRALRERLSAQRVAGERLDRADRTIDEGERRLRDLRIELRDVRDRSEACAPDERALKVAPDVDALLDDLSGYKRMRDEARRHRAEEDAAATALATISRESGLDAETLLGLPSDASTRGQVEHRAEALRGAEAQLVTAREQAAGSEAVSAAASHGVAKRQFALPVALVLVGLTAVGVGLLLGDAARWLGLALGLAVAAIGGVLMRSLTGPASGEVTSAGDIERRARAESVLADAQSAWRREIDALGLPVGDPSGVRHVLDAAARARETEARRAEAGAQRACVETEMSAFADRLIAATAGFLEDATASDPADVAALAGRAREAVSRAREAEAARAAAERESATLEARIEALESEVAQARDDAMTAYSSLGLEAGGSPEAVARMIEATSADTDAAERAVEALVEERTELARKLEEVARENPAAELRLEVASVEDRLATAAERYAVLALAGELLSRAQERYERERQPDVVRRAQDILGGITAGRYEALRIPLGADVIEVLDSAGRARRSGELSRGTLEQMYLALRLGLVDRLGAAGADLPLLMDDVLVNFDPERARGAARAILDLAEERQVVLFTCHPTTRELFEGLGTPVVIELDRC